MHLRSAFFASLAEFDGMQLSHIQHLWSFVKQELGEGILHLLELQELLIGSLQATLHEGHQIEPRPAAGPGMIAQCAASNERTCRSARGAGLHEVLQLEVRGAIDTASTPIDQHLLAEGWTLSQLCKECKQCAVPLCGQDDKCLRMDTRAEHVKDRGLACMRTHIVRSRPPRGGMVPVKAPIIW
jgi:hypothetical protein